MDHCRALSLRNIDAVLFDLDGVVTDTAGIHALAWKKMFDSFLAVYFRGKTGSFEPFDIRRDYRRYVDGKPRYQGAASFLNSRGIELPFGREDDSSDKMTICGLGNRKNELFHELLSNQGVKVFDHARAFIEQLRAKRVRTVLVTSSKNGRAVVKAAGIGSLFDLVVDGRDAEEDDLAGKPAPDIFLYAARNIGVPPGRAVVVEDAAAGVQAGRRGGFACVIGIDRHQQAAQLRQHGADAVYPDLGRIPISEDRTGEGPRRIETLPWALDHAHEICETTAERRPVVFLDYDGTLTPIVDRPEDAVLTVSMRNVLQQLAGDFTTAIVSGRDLRDVKKQVGLDNIYYAGSHGFEISGPGKPHQTFRKGEEFLPRLDSAEQMLRQGLEGITGAAVERKKFSIAVHFRKMAGQDMGDLEETISNVLSRIEGLKSSRGKKIIELAPDIDWHKGRAVRWLIEEGMQLRREEILAIYIGDDITDENAFHEIADEGIGILVADDVDETVQRDSAASYRLKNPGEVRLFLQRLCGAGQRRATLPMWRLSYDRFEPQDEALREALCTLGNGYFCTRGAWPQASADTIHYPGTYLAGGYNRLRTEVSGRIVENEDLVNLPNWLPLTFRIQDDAWFDPSAMEILSYRQDLDLREGLLLREVRFRDHRERITRMVERRLVHMQHPHLAALELTLTPENWSGPLGIRSAIDGQVDNSGVDRYLGLANQHLRHLGSASPQEDIIVLNTETNQSALGVSVAARTRISASGSQQLLKRHLFQQPGYIAQLYSLAAEAGRPIRVEKVVSLFTSRDKVISEPIGEAVQAVRSAGSFGQLLESHAREWRYLWDRFDLALTHQENQRTGRIDMVVHLYLFHVLQTLSINTMRMGLDTGVPSRGWHGEAYRGHVFWDELFVFPLLNLRLPEITRSLLMYRYRRLDAARRAAAQEGLQGAMYPWQSGSNGREESQKIHLNPRSGRWLPDNSHLQRHVNIAVAYNLYHYFQVTGDMEFMAFYGAEMFMEIARFWSSMARFNPELDRFEILGVMGPDEYHDAYPKADRPGLDNNAYTNIMAVWVLEHAAELLERLPDDIRAELCDRIDLRSDELERWQQICRKMRVVFHEDGIISQFEGYADLEEFDWQGYSRRYEDIQRLDRILEAEGDTPNRYKVSKQADVLMLFYLLSAEEISEIFKKLGYVFTRDTIPRNIAYYLRRTSHGSTLSRVVHAWVLARSDRAHSWKLFCEALQSDLTDIQGGTTPEGIHLGAMAGTVDLLQRGYTGLVTRNDVLWLNPCLPDELTCLKLHVRYRRTFLEILVGSKTLEITALRAAESPIRVGFREKVRELRAGDRVSFDLSA